MLGAAPISAGEFRQEKVGQRGNVLRVFAQRGDVKGNHVQAVEEVFAEVSLLNFVFQVLVGGGNDANIDGEVVAGAHRREALLLDDAQHFGLRAQAHVAHFVEEQASRRGPVRTCPSCLPARR